jgi:DNA-directed RNA polymerase specialized sigma24 family protein
MSLRVLQTQPDSRLVALAREGHEPAFEALVRRYRKELLSYCRRLQPQSGSAEDALQQALLQAWKALRAGADVRDVRPRR